MKKFITIFLILITSKTFAVELPKGTSIVKAYLFDCTLGSGAPLSSTPLLDKDMKLSQGVIGKSVELTQQQIQAFVGAFDEKNEFLPAAGCHVPHHGLVFYDKQGKAIGYYEVCFGCGNVRTSIKSYHRIDIDLKIMRKLFKEVGFPILENFKEYSKLYNAQKGSKKK